MPVSDAFLQYVVEQLAGLSPVSWRRMFGGVGLYSRAAFFAVIDDDVLYFRVGDDTRPEYEVRGSRPFAPIPGQKPMRGYYEVPADVLEDREQLGEWAQRAVAVARAVAAGKRKTKTVERLPRRKVAKRGGKRGSHG